MKLISELHEARVAYYKLVDLKNEAVEQFEESNKPLFDKFYAAGIKVQQLEASVKESAIAAYKASGKTNKSPFPGVTIKDFKTIEYNQDKALEWAKEHKLCLIPESLDVKAFEKLADTASKPDFVKLDKEQKAQIATDLGKFVQAEVIHKSDRAVHNEPAYPAESCDCGAEVK